MAIGIKVVLKIMGKSMKAIPQEYLPTVEIFTKPLEKCLNKDFTIFIVATIILIGIYVLFNFVLTKTTIGSSIDFLHLANGFDDDMSDKNDLDDFSDIDLSSIQVKDINKEIDDFF